MGKNVRPLMGILAKCLRQILHVSTKTSLHGEVIELLSSVIATLSRCSCFTSGGIYCCVGGFAGDVVCKQVVLQVMRSARKRGGGGRAGDAVKRKVLPQVMREP